MGESRCSLSQGKQTRFSFNRDADSLFFDTAHDGQPGMTMYHRDWKNHKVAKVHVWHKSRAKSVFVPKGRAPFGMRIFTNKPDGTVYCYRFNSGLCTHHIKEHNKHNGYDNKGYKVGSKDKGRDLVPLTPGRRINYEGSKPSSNTSFDDSIDPKMRIDDVFMVVGHNIFTSSRYGYGVNAQQSRSYTTLFNAGVCGGELDLHYYHEKDHGKDYLRLCHMSCFYTKAMMLFAKQIGPEHTLTYFFYHLRKFLEKNRKAIFIFNLEAQIAADKNKGGKGTKRVGKDLEKQMRRAGILKHIYTPAMKRGKAWPTVRELRSGNKRVILISDRNNLSKYVFDRSKTESSNNWTFKKATIPNNMIQRTDTSRKETKESLTLINHFRGFTTDQFSNFGKFNSPAAVAARMLLFKDKMKVFPRRLSTDVSHKGNHGRTTLFDFAK